MSIISGSYFINDLSLPNSATTKPEGQLYATMITKYEDIYLDSVLGYEMAKDLRAAIVGNPSSGIWYDLWKGAEYTGTDGLLHKWKGFSNSEFISPIANYVYFMILRDATSRTTATGEVLPQLDNATRAMSAPKSARAWNEMVAMNWNLHDFIMANESDYPDYIGLTYAPVISGAWSPNGELFENVNTFNV